MMTLMQQRNRKISLLISTFAFLVILCSCSILEDAEIEMQEVYQMKDSCGELILKEKLASNFKMAKKTFEKEEQEYYLSYCPDEPCSEIELETYELEVEEVFKSELKFTAIRVLDRQSGTLLHSVNDVLTSNGYHYNISWCPEAPPIETPH